MNNTLTINTTWSGQVMEGMYEQVPLSASDSSAIIDLQRDHNKAAGEAFASIIARLQTIQKKLDDIIARIGES